MDDVNQQIRDNLLGNANFQGLSSSSEKLSQWQKTLRELNSASGGSPIFDPSMMKVVKSTLDLGLDTVVTTFALFKLTGEISKMPSRVARKKEIRALRDSVKEKGGTFGASLDAFAKGLEGQEDAQAAPPS